MVGDSWGVKGENMQKKDEVPRVQESADPGGNSVSDDRSDCGKKRKELI